MKLYAALTLAPDQTVSINSTAPPLIYPMQLHPPTINYQMQAGKNWKCRFAVRTDWWKGVCGLRWYGPGMLLVGSDESWFEATRFEALHTLWGGRLREWSTLGGCSGACCGYGSFHVPPDDWLHRWCMQWLGAQRNPARRLNMVNNRTNSQSLQLKWQSVTDSQSQSASSGSFSPACVSDGFLQVHTERTRFYYIARAVPWLVTWNLFKSLLSSSFLGILEVGFQWNMPMTATLVAIVGGKKTDLTINGVVAPFPAPRAPPLGVNWMVRLPFIRH